MAKRVQARIKEADPNTSGFLGILEGNARAKTAAANAAAAVAVEKERQNTLALEALAASKGYDPAGDAAKAETAGSKTTMYIVIGVVLILMVGLYFIVKTRKR